VTNLAAGVLADPIFLSVPSKLASSSLDLVLNSSFRGETGNFESLTVSFCLLLPSLTLSELLLLDEDEDEDEDEDKDEDEHEHEHEHDAASGFITSNEVSWCSPFLFFRGSSSASSSNMFGLDRPIALYQIYCVVGVLP
jgi:hypothetical protein